MAGEVKLLIRALARAYDVPDDEAAASLDENMRVMVDVQRRRDRLRVRARQLAKEL